MKSIDLNEVRRYVEKHIGEFHDKRLKSIEALQLKRMLKRKNPYLFRAKNTLVAADLVKGLLDAHLSSQEEAIFGDFLEGLAIFVCGIALSGTKSSAEGIDLEFEKEEKKYIVSIKSGPNWGNSGQIARMRDNFRKAKRILRTSGMGGLPIAAVNGCCYGQENNPDKGDYFKHCGQKFWELISGNPVLYTDIVRPLGYRAKQKNSAFLKAYASVVNRFTEEFTQSFCKENGEIDWEKLVKFNSSAKSSIEA